MSPASLQRFTAATFVSAFLCGLLACLAFAGGARAKQIELTKYEFSFNGSDAVGGTKPFNSPEKVDIDQTTQTVYVGTSFGGIYKFNAAGASTAFTGLAGNTVLNRNIGNFGDVEVDNSGTATQGRIYALNEFGPFDAYLPSGLPVGAPWPLEGLGDVCGAAIAPDGGIWFAHLGEGKFVKYNSNGTSANETITPQIGTMCDIDADAQGNIYEPVAYFGGRVDKYSPTGQFLGTIDPGPAKSVAVDQSNGNVYVDKEDEIVVYDSSGGLITSFGTPEGGYEGLSGSQGLAVNKTTHAVYVANNRFGHVAIDVFKPTGLITVPDVTTGAADVNPGGALLHGIVNPDSIDTTDCHFEVGTSTGDYSTATVPCAEGLVFSGAADQAVTGNVSGLTLGQTYHYRLAAKNANGVYSYGADQTFKPQGPPVISNEAVKDVKTDGATIHLDVNPNGGETTYHIEWGTDSSYGNTTAESVAFGPVGLQHFTYTLAGLQPDVTYHFRVVATNANDTTVGPDHEFTTFPTNPTTDECTNAHVRQQTGAALLLDCRAYELVSAANAGGYDVESDIIPGQEPLEAFPRAGDRIIYSLHDGSVPGIAGNPTNYGRDPYVASRGPNGWTTEYVGLPANEMPSAQPFGSPLLGGDEDLTTFAFGENGDGTPICDPCFADGSVNVPLRRGDNPIVKGMAGTQSPAADPAAGAVRRPLSGDGRHLIFATSAQFESDGNSNGDATIYDRDLLTGVTRVVSKTPLGGTMTGPGISELDVSWDGSRVLIGQLVASDPTTGNKRWHLYLHVGNAASTIDLTPDSPGGVLYDGMSADGSKVYFRAASAGLGESDTSIDLYRVDVGASSATPVRVSTGTGGSGDTNSCTPASDWSKPGGGGNCDVVAFAGGAGVAADDGTVFFLSPELLDGKAESEGITGAPNLYVARPDGDPHFVATLDPGNSAIHNAVYDNEVHTYGDFQVTPSGDFAAFATTISVTGFTNLGHSEIYRYDTDGDSLDCASCAPTGAAPETDAFLTPHGLNLSDDGRVFFTSSEALALRDTNHLADAYEWDDGAVQLISTGTSEADSGIVTVSADGVNAFFFTRQTLVKEDLNGNAVKIYDARAGGGIPYNPPPEPCKASDECHGPGTHAAPDPAINTVTGPEQKSQPNTQVRVRCRRGFVKKYKRCVKRHSRKHRRHSKQSHG